jgi:hypothetical protein
MRWEFGEAPLAQTTELAAALRRVTGLALAMEAPDPRVATLLEALHDAERALAGAVPPSSTPRVGPAVDSDGRVYLDHARDVGAYNPCFPEYELAVDGDSATGTVTFPMAYEGPPAIVHGGFQAVFFDCAIQHHNCDVGVAGKTTNLELRYRRPAPLLTALTFEIERATTEDRIESTARLFHDGRLCTEAVMRALAGDRSTLPAVSPRRPGS